MAKFQGETKKSAITATYEWVEVLCMALLTVVLLFTFIFRMVTVSGPSMNNTFHHGDRLIISNLFYTPKTGDVVVVQDAGDETGTLEGPIIKRVIATAGETVDIDRETWKVTVTRKDGSVDVLDEPYVNRIAYASMNHVGTTPSSLYSNYIKEYPHKVEEGHIFVMGDNRNNSADSRLLGDIDERMILGKVYFRLMPNPTFDFSK